MARSSGGRGGARHNGPPQAAAAQAGPTPTVEARPKGFTVDVRIFLVVITTTMALAFTAGVMIGPTDPAVVGPVLSLLGLAGSLPNAPGGGPAAVSRGRAPDPINSAARKLPEAEEAEVGYAGEARIAQPKRTRTDHVATLGYKIRETHVNIDTPVLEGTGDLPGYRRDISYERNDTARDGLDKDGQYRDQTSPSGQHLLIDMRNLEADFLNSEARLAAAMQGSVTAAGLTMLSYHCHSLHPAGVSCVGVLLESHISFHTWPDEGVITLDMFTTSEKPLLPALPAIEALFGVPRADPDDEGSMLEPVTLWSHELRGFRTEDKRSAHYLDGESDLATWVTSPLEVSYKRQVITVQTEHQRIDIWDIKERDDTPSYEDGLKMGLEPGDPRWLSSEFASPNRLMFQDGNLMVRELFDDRAVSRYVECPSPCSDDIHILILPVFLSRVQAQRGSFYELHESLVHPAMFAHPDPKTVAIIEGGNGASLAQVLRHRSVTRVVLVVADPMLIGISREHLPEMSNCADVPGSAPSCFDDPRVEIVHADGFEYLAAKKLANVDVLIVDTENPERQDELSDPRAVAGLISSLSPDGIVALKGGIAPSILDPRADKGVSPKREEMINLLESDPNVNSIHVYEEAHCGYFEPRSFVVACRDVSCRRNWYGDVDAVDSMVVDRVGRSVSGRPSLVHYDGATHRTFQAPPRAWEEIYCRREPRPFECAYRGLDTTKELYEYDEEDAETSSFEVRDGGVYATVDIPEGSYVMPSHLAASLEIPAGSVDLPSEKAAAYVAANSHGSFQDGSDRAFVEVGGTASMRTAGAEGGGNVRRWMPAHPSGSRPKYSPVYDRHRQSFDVFIVASRDIGKGEEVVKPADLWDA